MIIALDSMRNNNFNNLTVTLAKIQLFLELI